MMGARIAALRRQAGMSQAELASRTGLNRATISRIEKKAIESLRNLML